MGWFDLVQVQAPQSVNPNMGVANYAAINDSLQKGIGTLTDLSKDQRVAYGNQKARDLFNALQRPDMNTGTVNDLLKYNQQVNDASAWGDEATRANMNNIAKQTGELFNTQQTANYRKDSLAQAKALAEMQDTTSRYNTDKTTEASIKAAGIHAGASIEAAKLGLAANAPLRQAQTLMNLEHANKLNLDTYIKNNPDKPQAIILRSDAIKEDFAKKPISFQDFKTNYDASGLFHFTFDGTKQKAYNKAVDLLMTPQTTEAGLKKQSQAYSSLKSGDVEALLAL